MAFSSKDIKRVTIERNIKNARMNEKTSKLYKDTTIYRNENTMKVIGIFCASLPVLITLIKVIF